MRDDTIFFGNLNVSKFKFERVVSEFIKHYVSTISTKDNFRMILGISIG